MAWWVAIPGAGRLVGPRRVGGGLHRRSATAWVLLLAGSGIASLGARDRSRVTQAMMPQDSLTVTVRADRPGYARGEAMRFVVEAVNPSPDSVTLEFSSAQRYDFVLRSAAGDTVWQWSADRAFAQVMGAEPVAPRGALRYQERFAGPLPAGSYQLIGRITAIGRRLQATTTIVVR